jgi:hypothetical protein
MRAGDHRPGLVDQGLGGAPVLAADGQDGTLGQSDGGGDGRPGVLGHLNRLIMQPHEPGPNVLMTSVCAGHQGWGGGEGI